MRVSSSPSKGETSIRTCIGAQQNGLTLTRAFVVARGAVDEQSLQDFVRERLSPHKVPREVRIVDDLPKTPSGKLDRKALR